MEEAINNLFNRNIFAIKKTIFPKYNIKHDWEKRLRKAFVFKKREDKLCFRLKGTSKRVNNKPVAFYHGRAVNLDDITAYIKEFLLC